MSFCLLWFIAQTCPLGGANGQVLAWLLVLLLRSKVDFAFFVRDNLNVFLRGTTLATSFEMLEKCFTVSKMYDAECFFAYGF